MTSVTFENADAAISTPAPTSQSARDGARNGKPAPLYRHMHPVVLGLVGTCFAVMMLVFWATFRSSSEAAFMVVISAFYLGMYIGTPLAMLRSRERVLGTIEPEGRFGAFLAGRLDTFTGPVGGWDVLSQVCGIPFALMLATIGICLVIALV